MLSLPMNEFPQQSFKEIGIEIDFKVVELEPLYAHWRKGAADEMNAGITANNTAYLTSDRLYGVIRVFASDQIAPVGVNWGGYKTPKVGALINEAELTFDTAKQDALIAQAHALVVDDAVLVWVVHDNRPARAVAEDKKSVQAQHWFQDLTDRSDLRRPGDIDSLARYARWRRGPRVGATQAALNRDGRPPRLSSLRSAAASTSSIADRRRSSPAVGGFSCS
jgi:hypothetical protein